MQDMLTLYALQMSIYLFLLLGDYETGHLRGSMCQSVYETRTRSKQYYMRDFIRIEAEPSNERKARHK